jgi:hypothetical protein
VELNAKRVELEQDRWADVRRLTVADISKAKIAAHERGWDDADLDAIGLLPSVIVACSDGDVTQEFIDSLTETDFGKVWITVKGGDIPNQSSPSSDGTSRRRGSTKGRTNG